MAMIAFSSLASIAGSVAWFTASRQVTVSAGTYAVVKTTTNLQCDVSAGVGTVADNSTKTISLNGNKLTDGSFNHKTYRVYTPNEAGDGLHSDAAKKEISIFENASLASNLERATLDDGKKVYTAVTWNLSFTMSFGANSGDYGLYLNTTALASKFTTPENTDNDAETVDTTAKGFRIAIVPNGAAPTGSQTRAVVFADLQDDTLCKYVPDTSVGIVGTGYAAGDKDLIDKDYTEALPTESTEYADAIGRNDYIGKFGFVASTPVTLNYTVVAWFEGTDPEIVNRDNPDEYQSVTASLVFDAVKLKGTSQTISYVTYNANGGSGSMANTTLTNGAGTIAANGFVAPENKQFNGWNTAANGSGDSYTVGQEVSGKNSGLELYAQWVDAPAPSPEP